MVIADGTVIRRGPAAPSFALRLRDHDEHKRGMVAKADQTLTGWPEVSRMYTAGLRRVSVERATNIKHPLVTVGGRDGIT